MNTIFDEKGQTIRNPEETLARWQRHFAEVLNVQKKAAEEVLSQLEDHSHGKSNEVTHTHTHTHPHDTNSDTNTHTQHGPPSPSQYIDVSDHKISTATRTFFQA